MGDAMVRTDRVSLPDAVFIAFGIRLTAESLANGRDMKSRP
jgi:hypothetical protein